MDQAIVSAIVQAAQEQGINPAFALAVAQRESSFNPRARASKTIRGLFQMRGDLRSKYGVGDSDDPYTQASGWAPFIQGVKKEMASTLGREPTDAEAYLGHHFGARRAARMIGMDPNTPVDAVFTPNEMALNPHFGRAGTVGRLNSSVIADIDRREASFGDMGGSAEPQDFSEFGTAADDYLQPAKPTSMAQAKPAALDLSAFGTPADDQPPVQVQSPAASAPDLSEFGVAA